MCEADSEVLIEVRDVEVTRGSVRVLRRTSMTVTRSAGCLVVGPNGAGKTTLLRVLQGVVLPTGGSVRRSAGLRGIGTTASLFGPPPLFRDLTVAEHFAMVAASWGEPEVSRRIDETVAAFNLGRIAARFPAELSSGERQLVGLTCVLARPFRLLLMDEPEQRLDSTRRHVLADIVNSRLGAGGAVVIATHDPILRSGLAVAEVQLE